MAFVVVCACSHGRATDIRHVGNGVVGAWVHGGDGVPFAMLPLASEDAWVCLAWLDACVLEDALDVNVGGHGTR